ncbi:hypothetical protein GGR58DRAFT_470033 [Xylaria digitata]|nr:hypothetical protein GGR58DRAFT_470033 [Xylaria digitata]
MLSTNQSSVEVETVGSFQFISIRAPDNLKDPVTRRLARSHAVKHALENKRKLQQDSRNNFRAMAPQVRTGRFTRKRMHTDTRVSPSFLSLGMMDPFQSLAVDSSRLQVLLSDYEARQSLEPVFNIAEQLTFQSFRSVFRTGLIDPALLSAVMHTLAFAAAGGGISWECLGYQGRAFCFVRERMSSPRKATSESTIGAILLLAGVEARLRMTSQVQLHMGAVRLLLDISRTEGVYLTGGIKRAIFWQDLNSSILAGSSRIVDHTTFSELQWTRDSLPLSFLKLPPGFQVRSNLFTKEFIEILEDVHALQCIRNAPTPVRFDPNMMERINNHTASIQSRLVGLPNTSPVMSCCHLAAYLCSVMLCCKVWCAPVIPSHISSELLYKLQHSNEDPVWDSHPDLLLWLLYSGGAFAPTGIARSSYITLLRLNNDWRFRDLYKSWPELLGILEQFIWSERAFMSQVKALWVETFA